MNITIIKPKDKEKKEKSAAKIQNLRT